MHESKQVTQSGARGAWRITRGPNGDDKSAKRSSTRVGGGGESNHEFQEGTTVKGPQIRVEQVSEVGCRRANHSPQGGRKAPDSVKKGKRSY